jgi:glycine betaine/proline transport system permease protein
MYSVYLCSAAILVCLLTGCPLGMLAAKFETVSRIIRPLNDTLQSIPLYIFLIPAVALFQVNEFSALVAIVLYAIVPIIRYTEHGLRHVPPTLIEAARANGCSPLQRLLLIELPVARPAILLGLNQTVLFALAMLIIAVLVGARGLAEQVNIGLRDADTGLGMTAGLSMAFIAIIADRILRGWATRLGGTDIADQP